jgi:FKBP-type peptidyl-prolyl cis-trans isomerase FklB
MGTVGKGFEMRTTSRAFAALLLAVGFGACGKREPGSQRSVESADRPSPRPESRRPDDSVAPTGDKDAGASPKPGATTLTLVKPGGKEPEQPEAPTAAEVPASDAPAEEKDDHAERLISENLRDKANYAFGLEIGASLTRQGTKVDIEVVERGIADAVEGKPEMDSAEFRDTMMAFWRSTRGRRAGDVAEADEVGEKVSYAIGLDVVRNLGSQGLDIIPERMASGIADGIAGTPKMEQAEIRATMMALKRAVAEKAARAAKENLGKGRAWLAENSKREGVVTLPSGLQYEVIEAGDGPSPGRNDRVTVHYTGTRIDGTVFDSSRKRNEPATFGVSRVIKGWTEALQLMKVGAKWKLYIPTELAYGERPRPDGLIEPNDALVFEVELLGIE